MNSSIDVKKPKMYYQRMILVLLLSGLTVCLAQDDHWDEAVGSARQILVEQEPELKLYEIKVNLNQIFTHLEAITNFKPYQFEATVGQDANPKDIELVKQALILHRMTQVLEKFCWSTTTNYIVDYRKMKDIARVTEFVQKYHREQLQICSAQITMHFAMITTEIATKYHEADRFKTILNASFKDVNYLDHNESFKSAMVEFLKEFYNKTKLTRDLGEKCNLECRIHRDFKARCINQIVNPLRTVIMTSRLIKEPERKKEIKEQYGSWIRAFDTCQILLPRLDKKWAGDIHQIFLSKWDPKRVSENLLRRQTQALQSLPISSPIPPIQRQRVGASSSRTKPRGTSTEMDPTTGLDQSFKSESVPKEGLEVEAVEPSSISEIGQSSTDVVDSKIEPRNLDKVKQRIQELEKIVNEQLKGTPKKED